MKVRPNRAMSALLSEDDLQGHESLRWPPRVEKILDEGWTRRQSGALVLSYIARQFNHDENDFHDITAYEASVNQIYVPDVGIDLAGEHAPAALAARGYTLAKDLINRAEADVVRPRLVAVLTVGRGFEGKPGGNIHIYSIHEGEHPWIKLDDLDGYQDEAVMVLAANFANMILDSDG